MGVPVKPIKDALGNELCIILAVPIDIFPVSSFTFSSNPYCPRCASSVMTTIFRLRERGSSDSSNFCIVVNIIPLASRPANSDFKSSRLLACMGIWRKNCWHLEN